jgi:hypothetical protein
MNKEVYFHLGLGKTGSTYMQYRVFPKFKGVYYIQRTKYKRCFDIIKNTNHKKYFVSNEFDRQFPHELNRIANEFPSAKVIIVLRRHDSWLASQYRRWIKNGYSKSFQEFIDLENDKGEWKQSEALFYPYIEMIIEKLHSKPLVLLYDDIVTDPINTFRKIADFMGATFNPTTISLKRKHSSYSKKQLLFRRSWNKKVPADIKLSNYKLIAFFQKLLFIKAVRYGSLYLAKIVPLSMVSNEELTPKEYLHEIREFYRADWEKCVAFAKSINRINQD